ncbi:type IX secretion system sortase PorU [Flavobacterium sp. '19STA2R22 D10 B1']|uniref:type IX secretion system sortase PorU n=1 Tax=Flavobacterium aerium TaxID=3037261 RepID=UPI00278C6F44|nr:type IX secretion system sortase PorU [Flavobacterium sp. '19STA2R22 D10 B1']
MKKILIVFLVLIANLSKAQDNGTIVLNWTPKKKVIANATSAVIPQFDGDKQYFDNDRKELFFQLKIPVNSYVDESSLRITNVVFEAISKEEMGDLSTSNLPSNVKNSLKVFNARDKKYAFLSLSPIVKENNTYKKIKSFSYSFNSNQSRQNSTQSTSSVAALSNSVLASGEWYRFYVEKSGAYRISKSFLQDLGFNVSGVNPQNIKIYGNGGRMIPLLNSTFYPSDLEENAIFIGGESDGVFNDTDYILFYAEGVDTWNDESHTFNNLYSSRSYYYITAQGGAGKRMGNITPPSAASTVTVTTYDETQYHELDQVNFARLGRKWYGEQFNVQNQQSFDFNFPNLITAEPIKISVVAASAAFTSTSFKVNANSQDIGTVNFSALPADGQGAGKESSFTGQFTSATPAVKITLTYSNGGVPGSNGYLDYIILRAKRNLSGVGKQFKFQYDAAGGSFGVADYRISNANTINQVWDITDIYNVRKVDNPNSNILSFKANLGEVRKYLATDPSDYYTPLKESQSRVANQNIKGNIFKNNQGLIQDIDYLIITPNSLYGQAERLANFHRNYSQLNVKVVTLESIYQEFSSGKQDIGAIRNFVRYVYFNIPDPSRRVKYLNLFGDTSFDYKNRISNNTNIVPTFHSYEPSLQPFDTMTNLSLVSTFMSDDFFCLMDDNEGRMLNSDNEGVDIAVGRMLVSSAKQAEEMVTKAIDYYDIKSYGKWRNNIVMISDDADPGDEILQQEVDALSNIIAHEKPFLNVKKIHSDSYVQQTSAGGGRYPEVRKEIISSFEQGSLVFNYLGHGGEDGLAHERIFEKFDGQNMNNPFKYPLFITITCEFTRFDNPFRPTAGEYTYWNPKGGAVAMITTTREIFVNVATGFNRKLSEILFSYGSDQYVTIAEALREAKASYNSSGTRVVSFVGDPAMKLAIPKPKVVLTKINGVPIGAATESLKSLAFVKLSGEVTNEQGALLSNYNGDLSVNVFDKRINRSTLGNDNPTVIMNFTTLGETIFRGNATVTNGQFEFGFVVPRDIRVPIGPGRVSFYAKKNQQLEDQTGYDSIIKVGGINENAVADNLPPRVKLYMNDQSFVSGGITNASPIFLAFLEDENGINTASGIGHDIVAILDGDENNPYILNDFYETALDDYTNGKVRYPFRNLEKGLHTLTFKAWDVYNNLVTAEIQFIVIGDEEMKLDKVLNYPNPFVSYTEFWFSHNRPFEPLDVQVQVMTVTGKIVWTRNQTIVTEGFLSRDITWDGRDDFGDRIGKGVYIYKLTVKSTLTNKKTEKYEKLVIL